MKGFLLADVTMPELNSFRTPPSFERKNPAACCIRLECIIHGSPVVYRGEVHFALMDGRWYRADSFKKGESAMHSRSLNNIIPAGLIFCLMAVLLSITLPGCATQPTRATDAVHELHYALIIDAGSSGSRIYIYKVDPNIYGDLPGINLVKSAKVKPGISEWEADPAKARRNLEDLITAAKQTIDAPYRKQTPLYLMATAGMRLLSAAKREKIMKAVSDVFIEDDTFDFKKAVVISGAYEGLYSWIAANYLDDNFDPQTMREGILEMGGASTQIAFVPSAGFTNHKVERNFRGQNYTIFTKSYLYMGMDQARRLAAAASCYPTNFPISAGSISGSGNFDRCAADIMEGFTALCENLEYAGPHCIFKQEFTPRVESEFFAISAFFYTFSFLGLEEQVDLNALQSKGSDFCLKDWGVLKKMYPNIPEKYLKSYCFSSAYFWSLLINGYRFPQDSVAITAKEKIGRTVISWTLGALIDIELGHAPMLYKTED
jgi:apyrase